MGGFFLFLFWLMSLFINRAAKKRHATYSFLFVHPSGSQLSEIGKLLSEGTIKPVVDKVFPFDRVKEALAYVEAGRAKGKVVVQMP
jgi:NADPH:quinone reductase-like Zn-dependent oxidoreductase